MIKDMGVGLCIITVRYKLIYKYDGQYTESEWGPLGSAHNKDQKIKKQIEERP